MKKFLVLSIVTSTMIMAQEGSFEQALQNGKFSAKTRVFYFDRSFDTEVNTKNATALTAGGIMKYESGDYYGAKIGFAYYGSHRLGGFFSRDRGKGTSILGRDGEDLNFLGEAYLQYQLGKTIIKTGRQQLATPLIQNHDLRILPSVYDATIIQNRNIPNTLVELGYIKSYTGFTSKDNKFNDYNSKWGKDGLGYFYFTNKSIDNLSIRGQYVKSLDDKAKDGIQVARDDYKYFDAKLALPIGDKTYIKAQYGGNSYNIGDDSTLVGTKAGTTIVKMIDVALLYDKISGNEFKAIEAGPMYSDWQQGYSNYEESTAVGGQVVLHPINDLSLKFGYVDVSADNGKNRDDFTEFNFDGKYKISKNSKIRVRYSIKDQAKTSSREDRDDFRIIYYMNF